VSNKASARDGSIYGSKGGEQLKQQNIELSLRAWSLRGRAE
jgi:hypothetical protein